MQQNPAQQKRFNDKALKLINAYLAVDPGNVAVLGGRTYLETLISQGKEDLRGKFHDALLKPVDAGKPRTFLDVIRFLGPDISAINIAEYQPILNKLPFIGQIDFGSLTIPARRSLWQLFRELVLSSGHTLTTPVQEAKLARAKKFNEEYRVLLENLTITFPSDASTAALRQFDAACAATTADGADHICMNTFEELSQRELGAYLSNPLKMIETPDFFEKLPYIKELPLRARWNKAVTQDDRNQEALLQLTMGLVMSSTGLDHLDPRLIASLKNGIAAHLNNSTTPVENLNPTQEAMKMLQGLPLQELMQSAKDKQGMLNGPQIQALLDAAVPAEFQQSLGTMFGGGDPSKNPFFSQPPQ